MIETRLFVDDDEEVTDPATNWYWSARYPDRFYYPKGETCSNKYSHFERECDNELQHHEWSEAAI